MEVELESTLFCVHLKSKTREASSWVNGRPAKMRLPTRKVAARNLQIRGHRVSLRAIYKETNFEMKNFEECR